MPPAVSPLPGSPEDPAMPTPTATPGAVRSSEAQSLSPDRRDAPDPPVPGKLPFGDRCGRIAHAPRQHRRPARSRRALLQGATLRTAAGQLGVLSPTLTVEASRRSAQSEPPRWKPSRPPPTSTISARLRPLGQLRESFILATGEDGLWIIDQHVAHERVLFEKILRDRQVEQVQRQRLLMPLLVELKPWQMVVFARIAEELERNGFEVEPFGPQTLAVKAAPVGLEGASSSGCSPKSSSNAADSERSHAE